MRFKFQSWLHWLVQRPIAVINLLGIILALGMFTYLLVRPIDVLRGWEVGTSDAREYRVVNGIRMAVYHPGDSLVFTSKSEKLLDVKGTTTRMIVCDATASQVEREIQLDSLPATRPSGVNPKRENAVIVPEVAQFQGLPRTCRIIFDIVYDIPPFRTHQEHAETDKFIVEEEQLTPQRLREEIEELNQKIKELEAKLNVAAPSTQGTTDTAPATVAVTEPEPEPTPGSTPKPATPTPASQDPATNSPPKEGIRRLTIVDSLLTSLGL